MSEVEEKIQLGDFSYAIVEDDAAIQKTLQELLVLSRVDPGKIIPFTTSDEALIQLTEKPVDIAIIDIRQPDSKIFGTELANALREQAANHRQAIGIVLMSGGDADKIKKDPELCDIVGDDREIPFLQKSFRMEVFFAAVRKAAAGVIAERARLARE